MKVILTGIPAVSLAFVIYLPVWADTKKEDEDLLKALKEQPIRIETARALYYRINQREVSPKLQATGTAVALQSLNDPRKEVRTYAVKSLGAHLSKDKNVLAAVLRTLRQDKEASVRVGAEITLGNIGPTAKEAIPDLLRATKDSNAEVRTWAIAALQSITGSDERKRLIEIRDKAIIQTVLEALKDEDPQVRGMALSVTRNLKAEDAVPALIQALKHEDWHTRYGALTGLAGRGTDAKEAIPAIKSLLKEEDNKRVREKAAEALKAIQGKKQANR